MLNFVSNNFTPFSLGNLTELANLWLSDNCFEGTIPSSLFQLKNLISSSYHANSLTGSLNGFCGENNEPRKPAMVNGLLLNAGLVLTMQMVIRYWRRGAITHHSRQQSMWNVIAVPAVILYLKCVVTVMDHLLSLQMLCLIIVLLPKTHRTYDSEMKERRLCFL